MENDSIQSAATSSAGTIVLNGTEVGLCPLSVEGTGRSLEDHLNASATTDFLPENTVLVDTSRGFLVSVPDGNGGMTYGRLTAPVDLQQTTSLLVSCPADNLVDSQNAVFVRGRAGGSGDGLTLSHHRLGGATELHLAPGASIITTVPTQASCVTTGNLTSDEGPKKRKGGWPKGKKRKNTSELNAPRAPVTGYVLFAIERRQEIKKSHPSLQFSAVTKILGNEWSTMAVEKKQKYLTEAEADKRRYIEELNTFQQSVTYQSFLKKRGLKTGCGEDPNGIESDTYLIDLEADYESDLYCRVCDQYFSSLHNKREHMFGRQHLQAITGELEKELQQQQQQHNAQQLQQESLHESGLNSSGDLNPDSLGSLSDSSEGDLLKLSTPIDIEGFVQEFHYKNKERDQEIRQLKRSLKMSQADNLAMCKQIREFKELEAKLDQDIGNAKAYGASLSAQIDGLKMVPTLFGVINF